MSKDKLNEILRRQSKDGLTTQLGKFFANKAEEKRAELESKNWEKNNPDRSPMNPDYKYAPHTEINDEVPVGIPEEVSKLELELDETLPEPGEQTPIIIGKGVVAPSTPKASPEKSISFNWIHAKPKINPEKFSNSKDYWKAKKRLESNIPEAIVNKNWKNLHNTSSQGLNTIVKKMDHAAAIAGVREEEALINEEFNKETHKQAERIRQNQIPQIKAVEGPLILPNEKADEFTKVASVISLGETQYQSSKKLPTLSSSKESGSIMAALGRKDDTRKTILENIRKGHSYSILHVPGQSNFSLKHSWLDTDPKTGKQQLRSDRQFFKIESPDAPVDTPVTASGVPIAPAATPYKPDLDDYAMIKKMNREYAQPAPEQQAVVEEQPPAETPPAQAQTSRKFWDIVEEQRRKRAAEQANAPQPPVEPPTAEQQPPVENPAEPVQGTQQQQTPPTAEQPKQEQKPPQAEKAKPLGNRGGSLGKLQEKFKKNTVGDNFVQRIISAPTTVGIVAGNEAYDQAKKQYNKFVKGLFPDPTKKAQEKKPAVAPEAKKEEVKDEKKEKEEKEAKFKKIEKEFLERVFEENYSERMQDDWDMLKKINLDLFLDPEGKNWDEDGVIVKKKVSDYPPYAQKMHEVLKENERVLEKVIREAKIDPLKIKLGEAINLLIEKGIIKGANKEEKKVA